MSFKRMSFKQNKVWVKLDDKGNFFKKDNKVLIKYQLDQEQEYWVHENNIKPESFAKKHSKASVSTKAKKSDKFIEEKNRIIVYTDGASSGNPGPSGIGIYLKFEEHEKQIKEYIGMATNNIAELTAILVALQTIKNKDLPITIYTDSSYSIGVLKKNWKAKQNLELINKIKDLLSFFKDINFIKVEGHSNIEGNIIADKLAVDAIKEAKFS